MRLDVYDVDATTYLGTLDEVFRVQGLPDLRIPGMATFQVDVTSSDDMDLLLGESREQTRRWVRFRTGENPGEGDLDFAVIVQDMPSGVSDIEPEPGRTVTTVTFRCPGALSVLGFREGGAVLEPYGSGDDLETVAGRQQTPRLFGPQTLDFPAVSRPEPTTGGPLTRVGWLDGRAERFVATGPSLFRRELTGVPERAGPARMMFTSAAWTEATVTLDGDEMFHSPYGSREIFTRDEPYDGEDHCLFIEIRGEVPAGQTHSLGWAWASLEPDDSDDPDGWRIGAYLFRTYNSTTFDGPVAPTAPHWQVWEDWTVFPGVTVGFVVDTWLTESQARGEVPMLSWDFGGDDDSDDDPWEAQFSRAFRVGKLGMLLDSLAGHGCEPHVTPDAMLRLFQSRGEDKSASVEVEAPFGLSLSGRGVQATRLLYETRGGFARTVDSARESALGVVMADVVQFGDDLAPGTVKDHVDVQLDNEGRIVNEVEVELPDDVVPGQDVWLGDVVSCESSLDGSKGPVRLTSFVFEVDDGTGFVEWSATGEPS